MGTSLDAARNFFKNNVCHTCKTPSINLKRCARCRILAYCSREHQMQDWQNHKTLCQIIADEDKVIDYKISSRAELLKFKEQRGVLWHLKLGRKLTKFESQMLMFPRICAVCFKREGLFDCSDCLSEYYCSKEHQQVHSDTHKKVCKDLKLSLDMECYFYYNDLNRNVFTLKRVKEELRSMSENMDFIHCVLKSHVPTSDLNYLNSCDHILSGVTILFGLEQGGVLVNRKLPQKSLEIHIAGATFEYYLNWVLILEIFFHWIKNLEDIHIVFIGPEVPNRTICFQAFKTEFCQKCQNRKNLTIKDADLYKNLYHEKVARLELPDIVVALNSGLHEFAEDKNDQWKDSLGSLTHNAGTPLLLTAYTFEEIEKDLKIIRDTANVNIVYGPKSNPFRNLRPLQDWETDNVYFINQFIAVIKKKC